MKNATSIILSSKLKNLEHKIYRIRYFVRADFFAQNDLSSSAEERTDSAERDTMASFGHI